MKHPTSRIDDPRNSIHLYPPFKSLQITDTNSIIGIVWSDRKKKLKRFTGKRTLPLNIGIVY